MAPDLNEAALTAKLEQLEMTRRWSPGLLEAFGKLFRDAEPFALYRLNPFKFAAEKKFDAVETTDLFLHSTFTDLKGSTAMYERIGDEICITRDVYDYAGVKEIVGVRAVTSESATLKGIARPMSICRVAAA